MDLNGTGKMGQGVKSLCFFQSTGTNKNVKNN